jgi:hypothetical protein
MQEDKPAILVQAFKEVHVSAFCIVLQSLSCIADVSRSSAMEDIVLPLVIVAAKGIWEVAKVVELVTLFPGHGYKFKISGEDSRLISSQKFYPRIAQPPCAHPLPFPL